MVTTPVSSAIVALVGELKFTSKVSVSSSALSTLVLTEMSLLVSPGAKVIVASPVTGS